MPENANIIPVVSVAAIAADVPEANIKEEDWRQVGETLVNAFSDTGFCYIREHGVDQSLLDKCLKMSKDFFHLPFETKKRLLRGDVIEDYYGWLPKPGTEGIDRTPEAFNGKPPDYKETYNLSNSLDQSRFPTDEEVSGFRASTLELIRGMELVSRRLLIALGYGLSLDDPLALWKTSLQAGTKENDTMVRYAFYPHVAPELMKDDMLRCGEHTDFGIITLLLDNGVSGLQIKTRKGEYLTVPTHEGALAVNIADSLERVTGGILRSAPHRVIVTEETAKEDRYSFIYFRIPDNSAYLDPQCGEKEKYQEKITTIEFLRRRFEDVFLRGAGVIENATSN